MSGQMRIVHNGKTHYGNSQRNYLPGENKRARNGRLFLSAVSKDQQEKEEVMQKLIDSIRTVAKEELERGNKEHSLFRSDHEAFGVIGEELWEVTEEFKIVSKHFEAFRDGTFTDNEEQKCEALSKLYSAAIRCACEMVQVAAMADKAIDSKGVI